MMAQALISWYLGRSASMLLSLSPYRKISPLGTLFSNSLKWSFITMSRLHFNLEKYVVFFVFLKTQRSLCSLDSLQCMKSDSTSGKQKDKMVAVSVHQLLEVKIHTTVLHNFVLWVESWCHWTYDKWSPWLGIKTCTQFWEAEVINIVTEKMLDLQKHTWICGRRCWMVEKIRLPEMR